MSTLTRTTGILGGLTLVSRVLGFVRDACIAWFFGAGIASDAFFVAFRIPNLLRRLFVEGSMSMAFVTVFTEALVKNGKEDAIAFGSSALKWMAGLLAGITLVGVLCAPWLVWLMAPGFVSDPAKFDLTVLMTRLMLPFVFFIGLSALCMGILNALGHFAAPALAPVVLNLAMISAMVWLSPRMGEPVLGLCIGVALGGALQLSLQVPFLFKKGPGLFRPSGFYHPGIRKAAALLIPTLFGAAAYQVNVMVGTFLASFLAPGSISYLYYADKLVEFPLGIFAASATTAVLPVLSRQAARGDLAFLKETFSTSLQRLLYVTMPAMTGLVVLREPIVEVLLRRGEFNAASVAATADALLFYGLGIWAFAAERILVSAFYAMQDARIPVKVALLSVAMNIGLACLLMGPMGFCGLALATSLASMLNVFILFTRLRARLGGMGLDKIRVSLGKTVLGSMLMGAVVHGIHRLLQPLAPGSGWMQLGSLAGCILAGCLAYALFSMLVRQQEFSAIVSSLGRRMSG